MKTRRSACWSILKKRTGRDDKSLVGLNPTPLAAQVQSKSGNCSSIHCRILRATDCRSGALV